MNQDHLDKLLPLVFRGERGTRTEKCLGIRSLYDLAERPGEVAEADRRHFLECPFCQGRVARLRRDRDVIAAVVGPGGRPPVPMPAGSHLSRKAAKNGTIKS